MREGREVKEVREISEVSELGERGEGGEESVISEFFFPYILCCFLPASLILILIIFNYVDDYLICLLKLFTGSYATIYLCNLNNERHEFQVQLDY